MGESAKNSFESTAAIGSDRIESNRYIPHVQPISFVQFAQTVTGWSRQLLVLAWGIFTWFRNKVTKPYTPKLQLNAQVHSLLQGCNTVTKKTAIYIYIIIYYTLLYLYTTLYYYIIVTLLQNNIIY